MFSSSLKGRISRQQAFKLSTITYRSQVRQLEMIVEYLEDVTPGRTENGHGESHSLLNNAYLVWLASYLAKLGDNLQDAQLWYCNRISSE